MPNSSEKKCNVLGNNIMTFLTMEWNGTKMMAVRHSFVFTAMTVLFKRKLHMGCKGIRKSFRMAPPLFHSI